MHKIRMVIVDDQKLFVDSLAIVLESRASDFDVVGVAYSGRQAVEMADSLKPAVILMDVRMPVMDGVESTRLIHRKHPEIRIIMLTTFDDDEYVHNALSYGAAGYILKNISPSDLINAIRAALSGVLLVSPDFADKILQKKKHLDEPDQAVAPSGEMKKTVESLTPREKDIIALISLAYDNRQIAQRLGIAEQTVKNHISTVFLKVGVSRRTQLMKFYDACQKLGLLS